MVGMRRFGDMLRPDVHRATITMRIGSESPVPMTATEGVMSGVFDTEELVAVLERMAGLFSTSLCETSPWQALAAQIRGASDIMSDDTQDAGADCNGICIGFGFEAALVGLGDAISKQPPLSDSCLP